MSSVLTTQSKQSLIAELLVASFSDYTSLALTYSAVVSALIGINVALFSFYMRMYRAAPSSTGVTSTVLGSSAALLSLGCAACGSFLFASLIGATGAGLTFLPLEGKELGLASIALLSVSTYLLSRNINKPPVCPT
jgi:hypothetical protein